jgi:hypothetical protein
MHQWSANLATTGMPSTAEWALSAADRDAHLAAQNAVADADDLEEWSHTTGAVESVLAGIGVAETAAVRVHLHADGNLATRHCGFSATVHDGDAASTPPHSWHALMTGPPTPSATALARSMMQSDLAAQGLVESAEDGLVFDALAAAAASVVAEMDPTGTAVVRTEMSAVVTNGSLGHVSTNLSVAMSWPSAAGGEVSVVTPEVSVATALADIAGLSFPVVAAATYRFDYALVFRSAATATALGLAVNAPAGSALAYTALIPASGDGPGAIYAGHGTAANDLVMPTSTAIANADLIARIHGVVRTGVTAGVLVPRFRSENAGVAVAVQAGSHGSVGRLA